MTQHTKTIDVPGAPKTYYAPAVVSTSASIIQISGQVGTTANGKAPASYESQIHLALLNLRKVLAASGARVTDIAKLAVYIVNYDPTRRLHTKHIQKLLGSHRPAMTLVPVVQLAMPEWLFEIDAVVAPSDPMPRPLVAPLFDVGLQSWFDVAVVGAGLSGLTAAKQVIDSGRTCCVLEARDRVGGKTWSQTTKDGDGIIDLGAAWINDSNQSCMIALARKFGIDLIEQNTTGNAAFQGFDGSCSPFPYGELPKFDAKTRSHLAVVRDMVEADCQKVDTSSPKDSDLDSLTFNAYLRQNNVSETAIATATIWTRAMLGQEPTDISALYFLNYCKSGGGLLQMRSDRKHGAQYLRCRQGTQMFSKGLAESIPTGTIRLSTPVQSFHQVAGGVKVKTSTDTVYARKVIVSVPTPVLKTMTFEPQLPLAKTILTDSFVYGYYTKAMMIFKTPFWVGRGFCGLAQSFCGPASVIRDTSSPDDNKWVLTCFLAGEPGREWSQLPPEQQEKALLKQIGALFADQETAFREFTEVMCHEWSTEQYSGWGCPCPALPPGVLDSVGHALREPVGNIHFVGTETAAEWKGYMEGAVRSGKRGADEVLKDLSHVKSKI